MIKYKLLDSRECFDLYLLIIQREGITMPDLIKETKKSQPVLSEQVKTLKEAGLVVFKQGTGFRGVPAVLIAKEEPMRELYEKKTGITTTWPVKQSMAKILQDDVADLNKARTFNQFFSLVKKRVQEGLSTSSKQFYLS